jgi:hypothetical protein
MESDAKGLMLYPHLLFILVRPQFSLTICTVLLHAV